MFLPGAEYILVVLFLFFTVFLLGAVAFVMGDVVRRLADAIIERTKAWQLYQNGATPTKYHWWFETAHIAGVAMIVSFAILGYVAYGPVKGLIKLLI